MTARLLMSAVVAIAATLATSAAWAAGCTGNVQFTDDFSQSNDPTWPVPRDDIAIGGGKFQGKAPVTKLYQALTQAFPLGDADVCVDISVSPVSDPSTFSGGLQFWMPDDNNQFMLLFNAAGQAALLHLQNGKLLVPVSWRKAPSLKTGAGVVNSVRLTLKSNKISIYFNDQPWYTNLPGVEPKDGGLWGFLYGSEKTPNIWTFSNLKVTDPSP